MIFKVCKKCCVEKISTDFPKGKDSNGLYYICKQCTIDRSTRLYRTKDPRQRWIDAVTSDIKGRSKRLNIEWSLTKDDLNRMLNEQECKCIYCKKSFTFNGTRADHRSSPSVDRLLVGNGYVVDNVVLACSRCNTIKNDATLDDLQKIVSVLSLLLKR